MGHKPTLTSFLLTLNVLLTEYGLLLLCGSGFRDLIRCFPEIRIPNSTFRIT